MTTDFSQIRTLQDVINVLSVIFFNMNEIERVYYDIFVNPNPMDVELQRYNDLGELETITVPNRAKDNITMLSGIGSPEGVVLSAPGIFYLDELNYDLYYKRMGTDSYGWTKINTALNFLEGVNYLSPTGDASNLTNLNMANAGSGVLAVGRGGTGTSGLSGLIKGNGDSAFTAAVDGTDFLGPKSMTGIIAYYPIANIPVGWLRCDGSAYSRSTYSRLFSRIGTTYGEGDGESTFNVPDLYNYFIRGWDGLSEFNTVQQDQVGVHNHLFSGSTETESAHTHTRGDMDITGNVCAHEYAGGAFWVSGGSEWHGHRNNDGTKHNVSFQASRTWSGATSGGSPHDHVFSGTTNDNEVEDPEVTETRVLNKMLVPVIKY